MKNRKRLIATAIILTSIGVLLTIASNFYTYFNAFVDMYPSNQATATSYDVDTVKKNVLTLAESYGLKYWFVDDFYNLQYSDGFALD